jgi:hypothetical protein
MPARTSVLPAAFAGCVLALAAPALSWAETLRVSAPGNQSVGQPLTISVSGVADGAHRLFAYADEDRGSCASTPRAEYTERVRIVTLSSFEGEALAAGGFSKTFTYTPTYQLPTFCAYLDDTSYDIPDVVATAGDPVNEYLENLELAKPTGERTGTLPGAIEPLPVNPQVVREYWERVAREAREHEERERRLAEQAEGRAGRKRSPCIVPSLKGRSLKDTRTALRAAHCRLGRVTVRRGGHGALVVTEQRPARGRRLSPGAAVRVSLAVR